MNSKTIKKLGNDKKYLRKDKNNCLLCKSHKKVFFLTYNPIVKIGVCMRSHKRTARQKKCRR